MSEDTIQNMRKRVAKCHRLAVGVADDRARAALLKMAREIERDVARLKAERSQAPPG